MSDWTKGAQARWIARWAWASDSLADYLASHPRSDARNHVYQGA